MKSDISVSKLVLIGVFSYLLFVIAQAPASLLSTFLPAESGIHASGLQGTLWNGRAASLQVQQHRLSNASWTLNGWKLFTGKLSADVSAQFHGRDIVAEVGVNALGTLTLDNARALLDAATVNELAQIPVAQLGGDFHIKLDHTELARGAVPVASGMIVWKQASITVAETVNLGDVDIKLQESDEPPLLAVISNRGGDIKLDGKASVNHNGDYQLKLNMKPSPGSSDNVRNSLKMFARPQNDGSYLLDNKGNLKQLGLM